MNGKLGMTLLWVITVVVIIILVTVVFVRVPAEGRDPCCPFPTAGDTVLFEPGDTVVFEPGDTVVFEPGDSAGVLLLPRRD